MGASFRLFAVKLGNFVEFRSAVRPPLGRTSKLTRTVIEDVWEPKLDPQMSENVGYNWYRTVRVKKPVKKVLQQTFYVGGRVVGTCTINHYQRRVPKVFWFGRKGMIEVSTELKNMCLRS